jgi:AraC-like DNA-binding protein
MSMSKQRIPTLNPLFFRILLYFLSLLLPIIIIGTVFYININNRLQDEFTQKVQLSLQSSANTIEIYLRTVQETSVNFFYEKKPLLLPYQEYNREERVRLPEIPETLSRVTNNLSALIDDLFLFADDEKVYTAEGLNDFDYFFEKGSIFRNYSKDYWRNKLNTNQSIEILEASEVTLNNGVQKTVIPLVFMNTVNGHKAILVTTFSMDIIQKTIINQAFTESTSFLVTDNNNNLIQSSNRNLPDVPTVRSINEHFHNSKTGHVQLNIGGVDCFVNFVKSESYGWNYYSITPVSVFKEQTDYFVTLIVTICLVLVVIGILFSFIFTFNLYNPIKRISDILLSKSELTGEPSKGMGAANEFERIGKGIHQLIEFNHKFKNELEIISTEYLDQALLNYIHGGVAVNERDLQILLGEQLQFKQNGYLICNIKFGLKPAFYSDIQDTERLIILDKIKKIIWGLIKPHVNAYILEEKEYLYIAVVNVQEGDNLSQVKTGLELLLDTFRYDSQYCYIHIGIGNIYEGIRGIAKSYADAMHVLEAADASKDFQMKEAKELPPAATLYSYSFMDEHMILNCLKARNLESLEQKVDNIISKNKQAGASSLLSEMYQTGCRFLAERGLNAQSFAEEQEHAALRKKTEPYLDLNDKKRLLLQFFRKIIQHASGQEQGKSSSLISTIMKYIEDNYHHDLYLEKISGEMGVSTKYVSRLFYEKTGIHLSTYISQYRISKAKELLLEKDLTINDISQKVGIYSRTTFIRLFKKYEGITPHEYRALKK